MSTSLKELNTTEGKNKFRFQSFRDRVEGLHFDVVHQLERHPADLEGSGSHFREGLERWAEQNTTANFVAFVKPAMAISNSLAQLLHSKGKLSALLRAHLKSNCPLSLEPILNLIPPLARDLQDEFYPNFIEIYPSIAELLQHKDAKVIEWSFNAIAYSFKYLAKSICQRLPKVFKLIHPLLGVHDSCNYLRQFAAESFGFLVRRVKGPQLKAIIREIVLGYTSNPTPSLLQGTGALLLESMKRCRGQLHSQAQPILRELLAALLAAKYDFEGESLEACHPLYALCQLSITSICSYARKEQIGPLFAVLTEHSGALAQRCAGRPILDKATLKQTAVTLGLLNSFLAYGHGARVPSHLPCFSLAGSLMKPLFTASVQPLVMKEMYHLLGLLLTQSPIPEVVSKGKALIAAVFCTQSPKYVSDFCLALLGADFKLFSQLVLPELLALMSEEFHRAPEVYLLVLQQILKREVVEAGCSLRWVSPSGQLQFSTRAPLSWMLGELSAVRDWSVLASEVELARAKDAFPTANRLSCILFVISRVDGGCEAVGSLLAFLNSLVDYLHDKESAVCFSSVLCETLLGQTVEALGNLMASGLAQLWEERVLTTLLPRFHRSKPVMQAIAYVAKKLKSNQPKPLFSTERLKVMFDWLKPSLGSYDTKLRVACFEILACFDLGDFLKTPKGEPNVFELCLAADRTPSDVQNYREKLLYLRKLGILAANGHIPHFDAIVPSLCLGVFCVGFKPLWSEASKTLKACSTRNPKLVGNLLIDTLEQLLSGRYPAEYERIASAAAELSICIEETPQNLPQLLNLLLAKDGPNQLALDLSTRQLLSVLQPLETKLDHWNVAEWILQTLAEAPHLAEAQGSRIVASFLDLYACYSALIGSDGDVGPKPLSGQPVYNQLLSFLRLLSRFHHPAALEARPKLEATYEELLLNSDSAIQAAALRCIEGYKYPFLEQYSAHLHGFLDEVRIRDELATFTFDSELIDKGHRAQLIPYVVRLLYGRLRAKKKHKVSQSAHTALHRSIMGYLSRLHPAELSLLMELILKPFQPLLSLHPSDRGFQLMAEAPLPTPRIQSGFLHLFTHALTQLGASLAPHLPTLLTILIHILHGIGLAQGELSPLQKEVRQLSLKRLLEVFKLAVPFDFAPYMRGLFAAVIAPRLDNLASENLQSPSALLELFLVWSSRRPFAPFLVDYDSRVLPNLYLCMSSPHAKLPVSNLVLELVENVLSIDECDGVMGGERSMLTHVLLPSVSHLLDSLERHMANPAGEDPVQRTRTFKRQVHILSRVAEFVGSGDRAAKLLSLLTAALHKTSQVVDDLTKRDVLVVVSELVKRVPELQQLGPAFYRHYQSLSRLFFSVTHREARGALISIFTSFALVDPALAEIMPAIADLNSFSRRRLDEPDYDRRLAAFTKIHDQLAPRLSAHQWLPLLHNFLSFLTDENEMSLRNSGSFALARFMRAASDHPELQPMVHHVILPTIKRGLRSRAETIRAEFIQLLGVAVAHFPTTEPFSELVPLLGQSKKVEDEARADEVEQTNFFTGIYHPQRARRIKVLSRLTHHLTHHPPRRGIIRSSLLHGVFLPICTDLVFNCADNEIIYEVVRAVAAISRHLQWSSYYTLFRRYYSLLVKKPEQEGLFLKLLLAILEGFSFDMSSSTLKPCEADIEATHRATDDEGDEVQVDADTAAADHLHSVVVRHLIPDLLSLLSKCPDERVPDRIPVALLVARLLKRLPHASFKKQLPSLLMNVCTLLKSRNSTTRDATRGTLVKIAQLVGAPYLPFIVKELQSTLDRGYMRHVLGFTVHALLVALIPTIRVGEIDGMAERVMQIVVEDMFGDIGQEKEAKEYSGKLKEAMARKSPLTLELLAAAIGFKSLGILLAPLKSILQATDSGPTLGKVDAALQRIANGLVKNPKFEGAGLLTFCHGLISQNIAMCQPAEAEGKDKMAVTYTVHTRPRRVGEGVDYLDVNAHKFVEFGLGLLLTSLRREKLGLAGDDLVRHLNPFVDIMGEALYSNHQTVAIHAIKVILWLMRHPLPALPSALPVMVKRALAIVHQLNATQSELVQACFKLLTAVIKDSRHVTVKDNELQFLLELIRPDLVEPSRQGTTFALIRAILSRRLLVSALYDLADDVGGLMVTSQSDSIRATCRQVYVQFFLEYPHGGPRIEAQMKLLVSNLDYAFESGRESVMEVMHSLVTRMSTEILLGYAEMLFLGLVTALINDDSSRCREMAGALIRALITRLDPKLLGTLSQLIFRWCAISVASIDDVGPNPRLKRTGLQTLGLLITALEGGAHRFLSPAISAIVEAAAQGVTYLDQAQARQVQLQAQDPGLDPDELNLPTHWEVPYYALHTFSKLIQISPDALVSAPGLPLWPAVTRLLLHPHTWVRLISQRLFGSLFAALDADTLKLPSGERHPYISIKSLLAISKQLCIVERSPLFDDELGQQWVKNMFFIGKAFYAHHLRGGADFASVEVDEGSSDESASLEVDESDGDDQKLVTVSPLNWLLKRCSYLCRFEVVKAGVFVRKTYIFQLFAALASQMDPAHLKPFLIPVLFPLFRTLHDPVLKANPARFPGLIELATEVDGYIKSRVDPTSYLEAINSIHNVTRARRNARKDSMAQMALTDPQGFAAARANRSQSKLHAKKRRKEELALLPGKAKRRRASRPKPASAHF
ncbi:U3 snoRNP protein [Massospora cicadina]|nr:U3 snoRNP protein [Massospora cicadina]